MLLVILGICILLCIIGIWRDNNTSSWDDSGMLIFGISAGVGIITIVIILIISWALSSHSVIDDKIEMYQEENENIETQIADVVKQYQEYESEIFSEVSNDSAITLVSLYPELKSDTLIQKQIDIYVENNKKIKELRDEELNGDIYRWWLCFGGSRKGE